MARCPNAACPAQIQELLKHFVSRGAMDIDKVGKKLVEAMLKAKLVEDVADLYYLEIDQILQLDRMAPKSASNVLASIEKSKSRPFSRVIFALGIRYIGSETADILAREFGSMEKLARASAEDLLAIPGIGPKAAESIVTFFGETANREIVGKLEAAGVNLKAEAISQEQLKLAGMEFVLTGKMESLTRPQAEARIRELGGGVGSSVGKKTTHLVAGEDAGSKLAKAQKLGTKILNETEFLELIG